MDADGGIAAPTQTHRAATSAWHDPAAIVLLLAGILLIGIGWLIGVVLLWTSPTWRTRDKLIGTLVPPGGLSGAVWLAVWAPSLTGSVTNWTEQLIVGVAITAPFCTAGYLTWRLIQSRRRTGRGITTP